MGDVDRLPSGRWQARTRVDGRQKKRSFRTRAEATRWLAEVATEQARGGYVDFTDRTTVAEYARRWIDSRPYRQSSRERRMGQLREHVEALPIGAMRLTTVKPSDVQAWATGRSRVLAPESVRNLLGFVRAVFTAAAADRLIPYSPASGRIALPPPKVERVVPLTVPEIRLLAETMPARMRALVIVQAATGLRSGELLGLQTSEVDFLRREVHVREQIHPRTRARMAPKTPSAVRDVPLPTVAAEALAGHLAAYPAGPDGFLFTNERGLPHQHHTFNDSVGKAAVKAGLRHVTTHAMRHAYASHLLAAGESVITVAARLGHRDASIVIRTYGHLMPNSEDRTRKAIDAAWCAPDVPASIATVP